ncbi:Tex family protein [Marinococcus luteus]|uniref:Tex family protein n=1 Tax=Marinococcus luteus TaxID=1122204 RepID=UPI002ACCBADF|nr:Tex family protein [Marinococcus luteus]MDZ5784248.1 Tex family protein [Marinococcus luteus]
MEKEISGVASQIASDLQIREKHVTNIIHMIEEGNTVPFIARYRKEQTGASDEMVIRDVQQAWNYANQLAERKEEVLRLIDKQEKLTPELRQSINGAIQLQEVEDLYRPYKQKRRTKATVAKEKGLEPLAEWLMSQPKEGLPEEQARAYVNEEAGVIDAAAALEGARHIISEQIADDAGIRHSVRDLSYKQGRLQSAAKDETKDDRGIYSMYYDHEESLAKAPSHRVLAMNRGESEGVLKISLQAPEDRILSTIEKKVVKRFGSPAVPQLNEAIQDSYKRLIGPAVERELRKVKTEEAETQAISVFSENLRNLLLQPPMKGKTVLGVDPAYRTGCKLSVVDGNGRLLEVGVIYPVPPRNKVTEAKKEVFALIEKYDIQVIAIGNGTASRETEEFIAGVVEEAEEDVSYIIVNEAGASVYSASEVAREEFPDLQVEERSAASIARRLQDPLAELVKIDPKSIGVGQYQHDVSQTKLNESLTFVVETAVNQVGVDVNSASSSLLQYVAGLSKAVANNVIKQREALEGFTSRKELQKVPRLGAKTYEQAAGFLRVPESSNPFDRTAIHPESYQTAERLLSHLELKAAQAGTKEMKDVLENQDVRQLAEALEVGVPTLQDIIEDLKRPNRDPRDTFSKPLLKKGIMTLDDLEKGMELQGTVRNVVDFGAFIDVGVKEDGLVHISKLANRFIKHPMEVVSVGEIVTVWVEDIDQKRGRVALTMVN